MHVVALQQAPSKSMFTKQNGCPTAIKMNGIPFLDPKMCMLAAEFLFFCSIPTTLSGKALGGILPAQIFT